MVIFAWFAISVLLHYVVEIVASLYFGFVSFDVHQCWQAAKMGIKNKLICCTYSISLFQNLKIRFVFSVLSSQHLACFHQNPDTFHGNIKITICFNKNIKNATVLPSFNCYNTCAYFLCFCLICWWWLCFSNTSKHVHAIHSKTHAYCLCLLMFYVVWHR